MLQLPHLRLPYTHQLNWLVLPCANSLLTALPHFGRSGFLHDFEFPFEAPTEHWQFWQQPSIEQLALTYLDRQPTDIGRVAEEHYQFVYLALSLRIFRTQNKKP